MTDGPTTHTEALFFGDIEDQGRPLALLVHGFPDTPHTWRHLGPALADSGWRVAAPWLRGYRAPESGPISAGTYVRDVLDWRDHLGGDERTLLIGHDWGANTGYGVVGAAPSSFRRLVTLAVPPISALGEGVFEYDQLRRSFYIWFIQLPGMAEVAMALLGFFERLWRDWSPGYDPTEDLGYLQPHLDADTIRSMVAPYRASFDPGQADAAVLEEASATQTDPAIPTLYLHGTDDGALGADILTDVELHLPAPGSQFCLVEGAGHFLHLEQPARIEAIVLGWLAEAGQH